MTATQNDDTAAEAVPLDNNGIKDEKESENAAVESENFERKYIENNDARARIRVSSSSYRDHYSLQHPSSHVRFRSSTTSHRVYQGTNSQFVLEERKNETTVKRVRDTTYGSMFLRACYTVVAVLWSGFLFVFCTQLLIFLIMDLAVYLGGTTGSSVAVGRAVGTILSLPLYVHGLASALIIDGHFVADTWAGMYLIKTLLFGGVRAVLAAWTTFAFYLGLPLLVMGICLCIGIPNWWSVTAIFWFSCVSVFYVLFAIVVIYVEVHACLEIVSNEYDECKNDKKALLKKCILIRQIATFSGERSRVYLARGSLRSASSIQNSTTQQEPVHYHESLYTRFTKWPFLSRIGMIQVLDEPGKKKYPIEESQGVRPFITYSTWTLDKLYCKPRNSWFVAVIKGHAALTRAQVTSSFACAVIGNLLTWFLVIAFLIYFDASGGIIAIVLAILVLCAIPTIISNWRIYGMTKNILQDDYDDNAEEDQTRETHTETTNNEEADEEGGSGLEVMGESQGVFQVCETYRITHPSERFCWIIFALEIALLYLWPLVSLYCVNDTAIGTVFLFVGLFSLLRYYLNAAAVLEEVGNMRYIQGKNELAKWRNQSRTYDVVTNISRSRSRGPWIIVLGFFLVIAAALGIGGLAQGSNQEGEGYNVTFVPDFQYERAENSLPYPTCSLDFNSGKGPVATRDFVYLSVMAYELNQTRLQKQLDAWFGTNVAIDQPDVVSQFRNETNRELSPVTYKLYEFPNITASGESVAVVGVRGSQTAWDWLTNAQLWSAAYGMQILRSFLPFGFIWNPIFDELVRAISIIESSSIKRVSYYKETTDFVEWLQESGNYADVKITGHSLGGGLSIITSAQAKISGIAVSGPNALMLRKTLDPPVTESDLDKYSFNIIPDRDMVPTAGGVAKHYENIQCKAAPNSPFDCHDVLRTLCDILFTCGTDGRPALCQCVEFGYPPPISSVGASFEEACGI